MGCVSPSGARLRLSPESLELSRRIYSVLMDLDPSSERTLTYKQVGQKLGKHWRGLRPALAKIQDECNDRSLPTLTALVVYGDTGLPGPGCDAASRAAFQEIRTAVKSVDWPSAAWW